MSFVFPKPLPTKSQKGQNRAYETEFNLDNTHYTLIWNPEPDYDELLIRLSLHAFKRLSPRDQGKQVAKICRRVNVEDVQFSEASDEACRLGTFAELFKKLPFSDQRKIFLSKVIEKFKRERQLGELISSFKQLDAEHQQQLIGQIVHGTPENLRNAGETEEEFRLRRFAQLSKDYTDYVYRRLVALKETKASEEQEETSSDHENGSNWKSCFEEFFLSFSVIWFQGQSTRGQDLLIEQLAKGTEGVVVEKRLPEESDEYFRFRRFTELCKNVVDFRVQVKFFGNAERRLQTWIHDDRLIGEPQDSESAAELLCRLWTFGVSLLSAKLQQKKIDEMSNQVRSGDQNERPLAAAAAAEDHEETMRIRRLTELFNQVPVPTRINLFKQLRKTLLLQKRYSEAVRIFKGLGSKYQTEIIEYMFYKITAESWRRVDAAEVIVEKISGESEGDLRFRRFTKMCIKHCSIWEDVVWPKAYKQKLHSASDPYDEFLIGVVTIWFRAKCGNVRRNPIQIILFGKVEVVDTIEKLPEESEEGYRLRRCIESFKQLEFTCQVSVLDYIQDTTLTDLGYPEPKVVPYSSYESPEGRGLFDPEWINYKLKNPRDQVVAATTQGQGQAAVLRGTTAPLCPSLVQK